MSDLDLKDWTISLQFNVPAEDADGVLTEALFEAALQHAPSQAAGMAARADTAEGKVWIVFHAHRLIPRARRRNLQVDARARRRDRPLERRRLRHRGLSPPFPAERATRRPASVVPWLTRGSHRHGSHAG